MTEHQLNKPMAIAAILTALGATAHTFIGTGEVLTPTFSSAIAPDVQAIIAVVWHAVTVLLFVLTAATGWLAQHPNTPLAITVLCMNGAFFALFVCYGLMMLGSLWVLPQWVLFALIIALIIIGLRRA